MNNVTQKAEHVKVDRKPIRLKILEHKTSQETVTPILCSNIQFYPLSSTMLLDYKIHYTSNLHNPNGKCFKHHAN